MENADTAFCMTLGSLHNRSELQFYAIYEKCQGYQGVIR